MKVTVVEVGPRDGLQNESVKLSVAQRVQLVETLISSGLKRIEVGAFVSPKWVPQMFDTAEVTKRLLRREAAGVRLSVLVPNERGMLDALACGVKEVAVFGACSETFSRKNINCSVDESFERFSRVCQLAKKNRIKVRGYLSTAFGCPYEGAVPEARVLKLIDRMLKLGVFEVSVGDTIGVATPKQVRSIVKKALKIAGPKRLAMHFHDTRGTALANVLASLDRGVHIFDSSVGGLGGCPYARGASGNLATEDLVYMLENMGLKTGVDLHRLLSLRGPLEEWIGHRLPGRAMQAGIRVAHT